MFSDFTTKCMLHAAVWISILFIHFYDSPIALIIYALLMCVTLVLFACKLVFLNTCVIFDESERNQGSLLYWYIIGITVEAIVFIIILGTKGYTGASSITAINSLLGLSVIRLLDKGMTESVATWGYHLNLPQ